jgi:hypothetical protein
LQTGFHRILSRVDFRFELFFPVLTPPSFHGPSAWERPNEPGGRPSFHFNFFPFFSFFRFSFFFSVFCTI